LGAAAVGVILFFAVVLFLRHRRAVRIDKMTAAVEGEWGAPQAPTAWYDNPLQQQHQRGGPIGRHRHAPRTL
jgi:hypothetical protein